MIISIFASIGSWNLWDELILKNEINILEKKYIDKNPTFKVFTYDLNNLFYKKDNIEYIEYFPVWIKNIKNIFRNIKNCYLFIYTVKKTDLIVVWWWGIFFDSEVWWVRNPLKLWKLRSIIFRFFSKKVLYNAIWIDIKNNNNLKILKNIFSWDVDITVRDNNTYKILKNISVDSKIVKDPVFYDKSLDDNIDLLDNLVWSINISLNILEEFKKIDDIIIDWKTFALAIRSWYIKNELISICEIIKYIKNNWWNIILLPHSFHAEHLKSNDYIFLKYFSDKYNLKITKTMEETYSIYKSKKIDYCIWMRLHSIILSSVYNIKLISLSYSKKTDMIIKR